MTGMVEWSLLPQAWGWQLLTVSLTEEKAVCGRWCGVAVAAGDSGAGPSAGMEADRADRAGAKRKAGRWDQSNAGSEGNQMQTVPLATGALTIGAICCFPPNLIKPH